MFDFDISFATIYYINKGEEIYSSNLEKMAKKNNVVFLSIKILVY